MKADDLQSILVSKWYKGSRAECPFCGIFYYEITMVNHLKEEHGIGKVTRKKGKGKKT